MKRHRSSVLINEKVLPDDESDGLSSEDTISFDHQMSAFTAEQGGAD